MSRTSAHVRLRSGVPRDVLLVLLGSGLAFLGTCLGQIQQVQITRAQLRATRVARLQESANVLLNDVSRDLALMDVRFRKVTLVGLSDRTEALDSLANLYRNAVDNWRLSEPRYLAQMAALFGEGKADLFRRVAARYGELGDVVVTGLQVAQPDSASGERRRTKLQDSLLAVVRRGLADYDSTRAMTADMERSLAFAIRDERIGIGEERFPPEVDSLTNQITLERSLAYRVGLRKSAGWYWLALTLWLFCGATSLLRQGRRARQPLFAVVSILLGPFAWAAFPSISDTSQTADV